MLNDVGATTVAVADGDTRFLAIANAGTGGVGENIFGPFEAGISGGGAQDFIVSGLGCKDPSVVEMPGGVDTKIAEEIMGAACGIELPRTENGEFISLLDECGGHTKEYHNHERLICLYDAKATGHSTKVGEAADDEKTPIYGMYETTGVLPLLDACGGHFGVTPDSGGESVYHHHVQDKAPFIVGCFGPNDQGGLVTVEQCRSYYTGCGDGDEVTFPLKDGESVTYDLWCPCYDADGSNMGTKALPVFGTSSGGTDDAGGAAANATTVVMPFDPSDGTALSKDATPGGPGSVNLLKSAASKHEPYLTIAADRTMKISVRGGGGSTTSLHPQAHGSHWIEFVYAKDQDGNVVCSHRFSEDETAPTHACTEPLGTSVTSVTSYEYCNLHGLWTGPTLQVGWEVATAKLFDRATQSGAVNASYFHSPGMVVAGSPVKHEAKIKGVGKETTIVVLGSGGSDENLHPHVFDAHYIEAVFAKDQHDAVAVYQELGASVTTAQSKPFDIPPSATSLVPYEFCNLHGLWAGATWAHSAPAGTDATQQTCNTEMASACADKAAGSACTFTFAGGPKKGETATSTCVDGCCKFEKPASGPSAGDAGGAAISNATDTVTGGGGPAQGTATQVSSFSIPKPPSGMFYYAGQDLLYVLCGTNTNADHYLYAYTTSGQQRCLITIPASAGMSRVDGFSIRGGSAYIVDSQGPIYASQAGKLGGSVYTVEWTNPCGCTASSTCAQSTATWSPTVTKAFALSATASSIGDGGGNDQYFRTSGIAVTADSLFAVNGVHPIGGSLSAAYPKSLVKVSLGDTGASATATQKWSFTASTLGHDVDMEALACGADVCATHVYIGDEYNYVYKLNLETADPARAVEYEYDLRDIVGRAVANDKGIESLAYAASTGYFYAGIQGTSTVHVISLSNSNGTPPTTGQGNVATTVVATTAGGTGTAADMLKAAEKDYEDAGCIAEPAKDGCAAYKQAIETAKKAVEDAASGAATTLTPALAILAAVLAAVLAF